MRRSISVTVKRGDILKERCAALVTSSNDSLVGNGQPSYWRFISRVNVDGAMRRLAGPELERECLAIEPLACASQAPRRDLTRWTSGVKHGESAVVRCPAGTAIATRAFGQLTADHVIHAVSPDSEFGYEGQYTGGDRDTHMSGVVDTTARHKLIGLPHFSPPDVLLFSTYRSAFAEALRVGAADVVCPALGTGVKGWRPAISAAFALETVARLAVAGSAAPSHVTFVIGGANNWADGVWKGWAKSAAALLGEPHEVAEPVNSVADAQKRGVAMTWELDSARLAAGRSWDASQHDQAGSPLDEGAALLGLRDLAELKELLANREKGYHGKDEPLTPEQELAATKRRTKR